MSLLLCGLFLQASGPDTLRVKATAAPTVFDGRATAREYGVPDVELGAKGAVQLWIRRDGASVTIAVHLSDSTRYWGDAVIVSVDPRGDGAAAPADDDAQWTLRRAPDSSVVARGRHGRWVPPGDDPDWRLGSERGGEGWELRTHDDGDGWSVELRLDAEWLGGHAGRLSSIAIRTYDDAPQQWRAWPLPAGMPAPVLESRPALWAPVLLDQRSH